MVATRHAGGAVPPGAKRLQSFFTRFAGADPDHIVQLGHEHFAVPDLTGLSACRIVSTTFCSPASEQTTSIFTLGTKSTVYSVPRYVPLCPSAGRTRHFRDGHPVNPCSAKAFFTSSSLKCRMMASTFFMI